jgi:hypothetical protein
MSNAQTLNSRVGGMKDNEIPAILQKGEYVLSKKDVNNIKEAGNRYGSPEKAGQFASGDQMQSPNKNEIVIINSIDSSVMEEWANSRTGREVINNIIER